MANTQGNLIKSSSLGVSGVESNSLKLITLGSRIFICGQQNNPNDISIATLWITNPQGNVLNTVQLGYNNLLSQSYSITTCNNKIYIWGIQTNTQNQKISTLWITDIQGNLLKTTSLGSTSKVEFMLSSNICSKNNFIYIIATDSEQSPYKIKLWILDFLGTIINVLELGNSTKASDSFSMICYKEALYITGPNLDNTNENLTLWVRDLQGQPINLTTLTSNFLPLSNFFSVFDDQLFISGNSNGQGTVWKCDLQGNILESSSLHLDGQSITWNLTTANNKTYATSIEVNDTSYTCLLWTKDIYGNFTNITRLSDLNLSKNTVPFFPIFHVSKFNYIGGQKPDITNSYNIATLWLTDSQGSIIKTLSIGNLESN